MLMSLIANSYGLVYQVGDDISAFKLVCINIGLIVLWHLSVVLFFVAAMALIAIAVLGGPKLKKTDDFNVIDA